MLSNGKGFMDSGLSKLKAKVKGNEPVLRLGHGAQLLSQLACRTLGRSDAHSPWWAGLGFALWPVGQLEGS